MKKRKILIIFMILIILFSTISLTLGKYIYNSVWNYYISSKGFYFESDLLDINTKKNSNLKWDGTNIFFELKNSSRNGLVSEYDITYKITCEVLGDEADYVSCIINDTNYNSYGGTLSTVSYCKNNIDSTDVSSLEKTECEINGYNWYNEVATKSNYFNLQSTNEEKQIDEVSVKITVESLKPYNKKLIGIFNLNKLEDQATDLIIDYQNYNENIELSLTNISTKNKCVEINFDSNDYAVDLSDSIIDYSVDNDKINNLTVEIPKENSVITVFYKKNYSKKYLIDDFVVLEKEC